MIITIADKPFRLGKFPAIAGRKLMTCGNTVHGIMGKDLGAWLPFLSYVEVGLSAELWIPLSTAAMVENHVPENERANLLLAVLKFNCHTVENLLSGPTVVDALWAELYSAIEDGFKWAY